MGTEGIVPRWEWRTFDEVEPAAARLASETPDMVHDSDELYVVSVGGEATVKVRDGLVDVKRLEEIDDHGLERWRPVLKRPSTMTGAYTISMSVGATVAAAVSVPLAMQLDSPLLGLAAWALLAVVGLAVFLPMTFVGRRRPAGAQIFLQ